MYQITGRTRLAGVLGDPVEHSRSPRLHNHWLARYGIDGIYVPLRVAPASFAAALAGLGAAGFVGLNVTLPHKEAAFRLVDRRDRSAERSGAVNTIVFDKQQAIGSNTDGAGFIANLPQLSVIPWDTRRTAVGDADLLVNTTSVGLQDPFSSPIELSRAPPTLVVADIIYTPRQTLLLRHAAERGLRSVGGLGMLLHQARPGFRAWFGVDPAVDPALEAATASDIL